MMRTYSRRGKAEQPVREPPTKRRRLSRPETDIPANLTTSKLSGTTSDHAEQPQEDPTSDVLTSDMPSDDTSFSSVDPQSTPPSSPPPCNGPQPKQNAFSLLRRASSLAGTTRPKAKIRTVLNESSGNTRPSKPHTKTKTQPLTQLHLDLGQSFSRRCEECGMSYVLTNTEDVALHKKFHAQNVGGVDFGKALLESQRLRSNTVWEGTGGNRVLVCSQKDSAELKRNARVVLDLVTEELGAVQIDDTTLWGATKRPPCTQDTDSNDPPADRFRMFLYLRKTKCVALCLAERVDEAFRVVGPIKQSGDSTITMSSKKYPVLMGISRIWTSKEHRGKGLAMLLLNIARENFVYGVDIQDESIAFSQPTESGTFLAKKWFGAEAGWHVYDGT